MKRQDFYYNADSSLLCSDGDKGEISHRVSVQCPIISRGALIPILVSVSVPISWLDVLVKYLDTKINFLYINMKLVPEKKILKVVVVQISEYLRKNKTYVLSTW